MTQPTQTPSPQSSAIPAAPLLEHTGTLLTDIRPVKLQLIEDREKTGKVVVRGEFGRADEATANGRVYPTQLWEREFSRLEQQVGNRQMFGELDHPTDGRTSLNRVSHIVTNLRLENGIVVGEAEILDTERGRNLAAMLKAGCAVGVSSRGYGSTKMNEQGKEVVQPDYRLVTYDFVAEPADSKALPKVFFESVQSPEFEAKLSEEKQKLRDEFAKELVTSLIRVKLEAREQARTELLADPEIAGAKTALDQVITLLRPFVLGEAAEGLVKEKDAEIASLKSVIAERDAQIAEMEKEGDKLAEAARSLGYKYYVEQQLANDTDAPAIRKMLGDVSAFSSAEEIKGRIQSLREGLNSKRQEQALMEEKIRAEVERAAEAERAEAERAMAEAKRAKAEASKLQEALEKAVEGQKDMALRLYIEKRLATHPHAGKLRGVLESSHPTSKSEVDEILNSFASEPARDPDQLEQVRARVRKLTQGGQGSTALDEEAPAPKVGTQRQPDFAGLGVPLNELQRLSGINRK